MKSDNDVEKHNYLSQLQCFFGDLEFSIHAHAGGNGGKQEREAITVVSSNTKNLWGYLKRCNAQGSCVYVRPCENVSESFLLLDDLTLAAAQKHLSRPGRLVIESSRGNYQVWIRFSAPVSLEHKKYLIRLAGADSGAHPVGRWGRCPGFSNRKPKRIQASSRWADGRIDWVYLVGVTEGVTDVTSLPAPPLPAPAPLPVAEAGAGSTDLWQLANITRAYYHKACTKADVDLSVVDMSLSGLLRRKGATLDQISSLLLQYSPNVQERKGGRADEYCHRTAAKAA